MMIDFPGWRGDSGMIVVCGAGGFIGGHLVRRLTQKGEVVKAIDIKPFSQWYQIDPHAENMQSDLSLLESCLQALRGARTVFNLASDMGGMGFIEGNKAKCMLNVLINTHLLIAAEKEKVERFFFASSACVYAASKQERLEAVPLKESDAYPAMPEDGYGWEKLFSERMCRHFSEDFGLPTRVARFHNVYGPWGTFSGGREKAPAALCRKVIHAKLSGSNAIEIWGSGGQTRSFTYIDDCLRGIDLLVRSDVQIPVNVGSSELVTIDQLVDVIEEIAGTKVKRTYLHNAPTGVAGRNSDNTLIKQLFGWEPSTPLIKGLTQTYAWILDQVENDRLSTKRIATLDKH